MGNDVGQVKMHKAEALVPEPMFSWA